MTRREHLRDRMIDMLPIRWEDATEHGQLDVARLRKVKRRAQVFRQARPAEGEAWLEISPGDIELGVLADEIHHFERIDTERLAKPCGLVRKRDFQSVEIVAAILDHFRSTDGRRMERAWQMPEQLSEQCNRCVGVGANDGVARLVIVLDR